MLEIIAALPRSARVHLVGFSEKQPDSAVAPPHGITSFNAVPGLIRIRKRPIALITALTKSLLFHRPYSIVKYPKKAMRKAIARHCIQSPPDVIITSVFTRHLIPSGPWKVILDVHNIEHALWQSFLPVLPFAKAAFVRREASLLETVERAAWDGADGIIAISAEDEAVIRKASPSTPVRHVPVRIAVSNTIPQKPNSFVPVDIGMIGVWSWAPNAAAVESFARSVMPDLAKAGIRVRITGKGLDAKVKERLERLGVDCTGHVQDVSDFYQSVRIIAAPYTLGGGVRMKVAEALGWGRPVIGTALAFQGIGPGVPPDWIVKEVEDLSSRLIQHASALPAVPLDLIAAHKGERQQKAIGSLFAAVGLPS